MLYIQLYFLYTPRNCGREVGLLRRADDYEADRRQWKRVAAECACVNLRKTARAVTQFFDKVLEPSGLRATQFTVLVAVALTDPATMTRIARALVMDGSTLTRNLRPLELAGLVKTAGGKDRRTRFVRLTPRGRDRLAAALPLWEQAQHQVMRRVGGSRWHGILHELSAVQTLARDSQGGFLETQ
jgi:DNA-binding MarR family transcriptional regulator